MIEYKLSKSSFIGGWFIDEKICDNLIEYFKKNPNKRKGQIFDNNKAVINKDVKDSTEVSFTPNTQIKEWLDYQTELQKILNLYLKKYPDANEVAEFSILQNTNLQHYKVGAGYTSYHTERMCTGDCLRHLVFMTYLNDVENGGTEYKNQKIKLPAKKGLTVIWPTDWTHTHRGVISKTQDKYIITGWFNYV